MCGYELNSAFEEKCVKSGKLKKLAKIIKQNKNTKYQSEENYF